MRALLAAFLLWAPAALAAGPAPLDGTEWKIHQKSFAAKIVFWHFDRLSFHDGICRSRDWSAKGFSEAPYISSTPGDAVTWTASFLSPNRGKIVWEGRREGDRMAGTWTWQKPNGKTKRMSWVAKKADRR